jgi:hypothetical protein
MEMSLIRRIIPILIFLLVVAVAWIGFSIYFQSSGVEVDTNATNYTKPISPTFNKEVLDKVSSKTAESFPVSPDEFLKLNALD